MTGLTSVREEGSPPPPWSTDAGQCAQQWRALFNADGVAVGVIEPTHPRPYELFAADGLDERLLAAWCQEGYADDALLAQAMRSGVASTPRQSAGHWAGHGDDTQALTVMTPQSLEAGRWWWLAAVRRGDPFEPAQVREADRLLRRWAARFNLPDEPGMGRLIVGRDHRPIAYDLDTAQKLADQPALIDDLLEQVTPVLEQRFPDLALDQVVDLAVQLGDVPVWVWVRRSRALALTEAERWHIDLRPLQENELPVVGRVKDDRVARAIAYLHTHYPEAPSLTAVAQHAHMSPFHFHRLFNQQVGVTPKQYLQAKQFQMAKWLLRSTNNPIGAIAQQTGFSSHGHFTSTFHRLVGVSPSQYRGQG